MFDGETLAKARLASVCLDEELRKLNLEEQRCQQQRQRLESKIACVRTIIALCEPAPNTPTPARINPAVTTKRSKPDGLPSVAKMIVSVLEDAAADGHDGLRPCDMAEVVRATWRRDVQTKVVNTIAWKMAKDGKLHKEGSVYRLPVRGSHSRPSAKLMLNQSDIGSAALIASRDCGAAPA